MTGVFQVLQTFDTRRFAGKVLRHRLFIKHNFFMSRNLRSGLHKLKRLKQCLEMYAA